MKKDLPERIKDWEGFYKETPTPELPWYTEKADTEVIAAALKFSPAPAKALDLGTGPGTMAIALRELGYDVVATDISPTAIATAKKRAAQAKADIEFVVDDVRETALKITDGFDLAQDRGCFHTLRDDEPKRYIENISRLIKEGGVLLLKTFSDKEPGEEGPVRYCTEEITALFDERFELIHSEEGTFESTLDHNPKAIFSVLKRRASK